MEINDQIVNQVASLAKLEFDSDERKEIISDLNKIIAFVEKIGEVDLDGVEPLIHITDEVNVLRKDEARRDITQDEALKNAPRHDSDYFKAPKVLGQ